MHDQLDQLDQIDQLDQLDQLAYFYVRHMTVYNTYL